VSPILLAPNSKTGIFGIFQKSNRNLSLSKREFLL